MAVMEGVVAGDTAEGDVTVEYNSAGRDEFTC